MKKRSPGREFAFSIRDEWREEETVYVRVRIGLKRMLRGLGLRITDMRQLPAEPEKCGESLESELVQNPV